MQWANIKRKRTELYIFKLQKKIYQASKKNSKLELFRLQKILITFKAAKLKAVRGVTQENRGNKRHKIIISPEKRLELANSLILNKKVFLTKKCATFTWSLPSN